MRDPELFAQFGKSVGSLHRGVWVELNGKAATLADRFNAEFGTTDHELMALSWLLASALIEHAIAGGTIVVNGGRMDGLGVDVLAIVAEFKRQREATGEIRT